MNSGPFKLNSTDPYKLKIIHQGTKRELDLPADAAAGIIAEALAAVDPLVVGIDPSMTCTALAFSTGRLTRIETKPAGKSYEARCGRYDVIADRVAVALLADGRPDLVVIEGPSYGSTGQLFDLGWLWGGIYNRLAGMDLPTAVAPPTTRMRFATGRGMANKDAVLSETIRRYPSYPINDNNTADGLVLMAMGREWLGHPLVNVPATHSAALPGVAWPVVK